MVEVSLAIGILAFAFVGLFGLLPTGLTVFRAAIDRANEMWIMQNLNSMLQVTRWSQVRNLGYDKTSTIFYFDEEGRLTDRTSTDSALDAPGEEEVIARRVYAVKLLIDDAERPGGGVAGKDKYFQGAYRVVAVIGPYYDNPELPVMKEFASLTLPKDVATEIKKGSSIRTRAFLISRMDSEREVD